MPFPVSAVETVFDCRFTACVPLLRPHPWQESDDRSKTGNPDRQRINLGEDYERRDWAKKFGVSEDQLRAAVNTVGPMATDVERELKGRG